MQDSQVESLFRTDPINFERASGVMLDALEALGLKHKQRLLLYATSPLDVLMQVGRVVKIVMNKLNGHSKVLVQVRKGYNETEIVCEESIAMDWPSASVRQLLWSFLRDPMSYNPGVFRRELAEPNERTVQNISLFMRAWIEDWRAYTEWPRMWPTIKEENLGPYMRRAGPLVSSALSSWRIQPWIVGDEARATNSLKDKLYREVSIVVNLGWMIFLVERPIAVRMEGTRLGDTKLPVLEWADGASVYGRENIRIPHVLRHKLTAKKISSITNQELRRIMMGEYGDERFLKEIGAIRVSQDEYGTLWKAPALANDGGELTFVEVVNGTAHEDGKYPHYFLRVPPRCATAKEAVAWTYGMGPGVVSQWDQVGPNINLSKVEYNPQVRT